MLEQILNAKVEGFNEGRRIAYNEMRSLLDDKDRQIENLIQQNKAYQEQSVLLTNTIEELDNELTKLEEQLELSDFVNEVSALALQKLLGY